MEGMQRSGEGKSVVTGQIWSQLSTICIRVVSQCLFERMHRCGEGAFRQRNLNMRVEWAIKSKTSKQQILYSDVLHFYFGSPRRPNLQ